VPASAGGPKTRREAGTLFVRMGLNYLRGLRRSVAEEIVAARAQQPFSSLRDLIRRVPGLNKKEIAALAEIGALNALPEHEADRQRRGALWQASAAARAIGPLLESATGESEISPLVPMTPTQRTFSDFTHSGLTLGKHPIAFHRDQLQAMGVLDNDLVKKHRDGAVIQIAGLVITRQRPGTAKGFVFLTLEDETGVLNVIVNPGLYDRKRITIRERYLLIKGVLQNQSNVVSVKAGEIEPLSFVAPVVPSHDFH
jgi:error-prone DNA polymerase